MAEKDKRASKLDKPMTREEELENALQNIEKAHGKGAIMRLGEAKANMNVEVISTGILPLDIALGVGGIPRGRIIEVFGPESSGKTTVTLHMIAEAQKAGGSAQADGHYQQDAYGCRLHQSAAREDRRYLWQSGGDDGRTCAEILCIGAH